MLQGHGKDGDCKIKILGKWTRSQKEKQQVSYMYNWQKTEAAAQNRTA